jgi:hypothetical protein
MSFLARITEEEIIRHYTPVNVDGKRYFVDRRDPTKILARKSHNRKLGEFRVEIVDDPKRKNIVKEAYKKLLDQNF